ncbi:uncharacterized protein LOC133204351 [Saccostrea echinata]|uniref:uncharacterized protein LOC133204351 n=1 Tax=Saccostrea echinata TaxID=191078 RepID=UPI002A7F9D15|nr:uncharacterized protein LOC133204351 [Saccostrea echinata]
MEARVQEMEKKEDILQSANQRLHQELDQRLEMNVTDETSSQIERIQQDLRNLSSTVDAVCSGRNTPPSGGLYAFSWTACIAARKIFNAELLVKRQKKVLANCYNELNPGLANCANTIPLVLKFGDDVNIRTTANFNYRDH